MAPAADDILDPPRGGARAQMLRNLGLLWCGQILTKGIAFVALATLARRLSRSDYGAVEYALGMSAFAWLVIDGGLGAVGVRRLTQRVASRESLAASIPAAQLGLALLMAPGMLLFAWFFARDRTAIALVACMAVSVLFLPWKQDWLFQALGRMSHVVAAQVVRVLVFALLTLSIVTTDARVLLVGAAEICSVAAATGYLMVVQHATITPIAARFSWQAVMELAREGAPIGAGAICWAATQFVPLFMLTALTGMEQTAYFGAAHRLGVSLVTFSWIYHFNLYPTIARRLHAGGGFDPQFLRLSVRVTAWGGIALALGLTLCARPLLALLFGRPFEAAAAPFAMLVWTFPITLLSGHARWLLVAAQRSGDMLLAQAAGVAVALTAGWLLIPPFGATGAGGAMTLACLAVWLASQRLAGARARPVPWQPCVPPLLAAGAILAGLHHVALDAWAAALAGVAAFACVAPFLDTRLLADLRWIVRGRAPHVR